ARASDWASAASFSAASAPRSAFTRVDRAVRSVRATTLLAACSALAEAACLLRASSSALRLRSARWRSASSSRCSASASSSASFLLCLVQRAGDRLGLLRLLLQPAGLGSLCGRLPFDLLLLRSALLLEARLTLVSRFLGRQALLLGGQFPLAGGHLRLAPFL